MNKIAIKLASAIISIAVLTAVAAPLAKPGRVSAKWLPWSRQEVTELTVKRETPAGSQAQADNGSAASAEESLANTETVITDNNGNTIRVEIVEAAAPAKAVVIDKKEAKQLQASADTGHQPWLLNPVEVVKANAAKYGFDPSKDTFTLTYQIYQGKYSGTGEAAVLVGHGSRYYMVQLIQPEGPGDNKIWQINSVREVKVVARQKPDVGPGVEGIDYTKAVKWQQNVDEGRELWRLDPLQVARIEGRAYGFDDKDSFTIVKRLSSSSLARHGEIHVNVVHEGKEYTIVLVRPIGSDDGAIWTIHHVIGMGNNPVNQPSEQPAGKVLFQTGKYKDWKWQKGQYPADMAFATVVDYAAQLRYDARIPEHVLERVKDIDYKNKVVLFAYLGLAPSGGYGIGIEKVTIDQNNLTVKVRTKSPADNDMVTLAMTNPSDFVVLDRSVVDIWGGVNVTFVDQYGKILSKNKLVITHR